MAGLDLGHEGWGYQQQAQQQAAEKQTKSPQEIQSGCPNLSGPDLVSCIADQVEAQRSAKHDADDLATQQQSATWATRSGLIAGAGLIVTGLGLWFILQNLREARIITRQAVRANRHSADSAKAAADAANAANAAIAQGQHFGEAQLRAYLSSPEVTISQLVVGKVPMIKASTKNTGQTPAFGIRSVMRAKTCANPETEKIDLMVPSQSVGVLGAGMFAHSVDSPGNKLTEAVLSDLVKGEPQIVVAGMIVYRDIFGRRHRTIYRTRLDHASIKEGNGSFILCTRNNRAN
ncbi:MAG: hypothetical protein ABI377_05535 [Devosia sp.]